MKPQEGLTRDELLALPASINLVTAGRALGISRTLAHDLARKGQFPVRVFRIGHRYRVPTAEMLRVLGLDPEAAQ